MCGIAAAYSFIGTDASKYIARMLLDLQHRGQLSAGATSYDICRKEILKTVKRVGPVANLLQDLPKGEAVIGHVRYATNGDEREVQPLERPHLRKSKWFSLVYNGQLSNYEDLRDELLSEGEYHLSSDGDTELILYKIARAISTNNNSHHMVKSLSNELEGAYTIAVLDATGKMVIFNDPQGIRPLCYYYDSSVFFAASEDIALVNQGVPLDAVEYAEPGTIIVVEPNNVTVTRYNEEKEQKSCFFEWVYFANIASCPNNKSVYITRGGLGEALASLETEPINNAIVVPVPATSLPAASLYAYSLDIPCLEAIVRNPYLGRTFIEGADRADKAEAKYTVLSCLVEGKRVFLVDDSLVRSTTIRVLAKKLYAAGALEVHVRIACPPIKYPCFYGIDMPTKRELFASEYDDTFEMAQELKVESLLYLPKSMLYDLVGENICDACITGNYPTPRKEKEI